MNMTNKKKNEAGKLEYSVVGLNRYHEEIGHDEHDALGIHVTDRCGVSYIVSVHEGVNLMKQRIRLLEKRVSYLIEDLECEMSK